MYKKKKKTVSLAARHCCHGLTSHPARAISRAVASEQELVAWVWKWIGRSVTERIASTRSGADRGFKSPAMSFGDQKYDQQDANKRATAIAHTYTYTQTHKEGLGLRSSCGLSLVHSRVHGQSSTLAHKTNTNTAVVTIVFPQAHSV